MSVHDELFGETTLTKYKVFIDDPVEDVIEGLFETVVEDYDLAHGDITPPQYFECEQIKVRIKSLLAAFVTQNQPL